MGLHRRTLKRALDLGISLPALVALAPLQACVAALIAIKLGRPVLFRQVRPGLGGRQFEMVKFRSMRPLDPGRGWIDDETRLTSFGRALRSTSLDELPALWNVVRGDMSLVGPRPLLVQYLDRYDAQQARRHDVLPGLTGLAQISGRNGISWEERLRLDVAYVDSQSFSLDLRILVSTVRAVLTRAGVTSPEHATMPEFLGSSVRKASS